MALIERVEQLPRHRVAIGENGQLPDSVLALPELLAQPLWYQVMPERGAGIDQVVPCLRQGIPRPSLRQPVESVDKLLHPWAWLARQVASDLLRVVLVAELETVRVLSRIVTDHKAHRALDGLAADLGEHVAVGPVGTIAIRRRLDIELTQVRAPQPGRDIHLPQPRRISQQLEHYRIGIPQKRHVNGLPLRAEHTKTRGMHNQKDVPALQPHRKGPERRISWLIDDDAGQKAEWLSNADAAGTPAFEEAPRRNRKPSKPGLISTPAAHTSTATARAGSIRTGRDAGRAGRPVWLLISRLSAE